MLGPDLIIFRLNISLINFKRILCKKNIVIIDDPDDIDIIGSVVKQIDSGIHYISFTCPVGAIKQFYTDEFIIPDYVFIDHVFDVRFRMSFGIKKR